MSEVIINVFLEDNCITIRMENDSKKTERRKKIDYSDISIDSVRYSSRLVFSSLVSHGC